MHYDEWCDEDGASRARRQHVMLYTVGLDGLEFKDILEILKKYSIDRIEDIRGLDKGEEEYFSLPPVFYSNDEGFSPKRSEFYLYPNGYLDFNLCRLSKKFRQAQWEVEKVLMGDKNILLLSEEREPIDSHRGIFLGKVFFWKGYKVHHIVGKKIIEQEELEDRLMKRYHPGEEKTKKLLLDCYQKQNIKIGWRPKLPPTMPY